MKKVFLCFVFALGSIVMFAQSVLPQSAEPIELTESAFDPIGPNGIPRPKNPQNVPQVWIDYYTLFFGDTFSEMVPIVLTDVSGIVVYSTNLPVGTQTLVLPATLSGTYTIYIYVGGLCYYGQIAL